MLALARATRNRAGSPLTVTVGLVLTFGASIFRQAVPRASPLPRHPSGRRGSLPDGPLGTPLDNPRVLPGGRQASPRAIRAQRGLLGGLHHNLLVDLHECLLGSQQASPRDSPQVSLPILPGSRQASPRGSHRGSQRGNPRDIQRGSPQANPLGSPQASPPIRPGSRQASPRGNQRGDPRGNPPDNPQGNPRDSQLIPQASRLGDPLVSQRASPLDSPQLNQLDGQQGNQRDSPRGSPQGNLQGNPQDNPLLSQRGAPRDSPRGSLQGSLPANPPENPQIQQASPRYSHRSLRANRRDNHQDNPQLSPQDSPLVPQANQHRDPRNLQATQLVAASLPSTFTALKRPWAATAPPAPLQPAKRTQACTYPTSPATQWLRFAPPCLCLLASGVRFV